MFEGGKRFKIVVRLPGSVPSDVEALENLPVPLPEIQAVPTKASMAGSPTTIRPFVAVPSNERLVVMMWACS